MNQLNSKLPLEPQEAVKLILAALPSRRMRDIVEKRFGLKGREKQTLESVGREYHITRERVRQIEADALKILRREEVLRPLAPFFDAAAERIREQGGVVGEPQLYLSLADARFHSHCAFLLDTAPGFIHFPENEFFAARWTVRIETARRVEEMLKGLLSHLEGKSRPLSKSEYEALIKERAKTITGSAPGQQVLNSYLSLFRGVGVNPYGECGLYSSPLIKPRGIRDKAYLVLAKSGAPMHFRKVAGSIDRVRWNSPPAPSKNLSFKKANPQTVHNELIKDERFVLVGRGLYALKEWGYEPGAVRDVLVSVFKQAGQPLSKEEVVGRVSEKRVVKAPTVLLNLQNRTLFKRMEDGRYTLA